LGVLSVAALLLGASTVSANLLTDPGFEANALLPGVGVLTNIPGNAGVWGTENANIVGTTGGVSPAGGVKMLQMLDDQISYTQGWQAVDVSGSAAQIDAGLMGYTASALYNVDSSVPAALAGTAVSFVDSTGVWGNFTGPSGSASLVLDANPSTWQAITDSGMVPAGTRWLVIQVAYNDASLMGTAGIVEAGFVDDAVLDIRAVPEPATVALMGLVAVAVGWSRPRRQKAAL
jgi:hypothetical protein